MARKYTTDAKVPNSPLNLEQPRVGSVRFKHELLGLVSLVRKKVADRPGHHRHADCVSADRPSMEHENVSVTAEKANPVFVREGEADTVRQGAVITVSDSAENAQYRPGSMYDGKKDTAWLTGGAQSEHDIDIHWFCRNMNVSGIMIDFTPTVADMLEEGDTEGVANTVRATREWRRP